MPVELTASAKRKLAREKARRSTIGQPRKAADKIAQRSTRSESALNLAKQAFQRASGAGKGKKGNQSTDSNQ